MFGSATLDVAVGLIFIFFLVSILCSSLREGIEAWFKTRAAYLERGIRELLQDREGKGLVRDFFQHPLIDSLFSGHYAPSADTGISPALLAKGRNLPSYIPSRNFAQALMDLAARGPRTTAGNSTASAPILSLDSLRASLNNLDNKEV